jgi:type IV pilus assembly protein PilX
MTKVCNTAYIRNRSVGSQCGASLIVVLMILVIVSLIGVAASQIALMSERGARNDRDRHIAFQAAEAALYDAELDMRTSVRSALFDGKNAVAFLPGCGNSGNSRGLCDDSLVAGKPAWLAVDFELTGNDAPTVAYGTFTGRSFAAGGAGVRAALVPRYIIELVPEVSGTASQTQFLYRVTAMGFGPRQDIQVVLQMIYRP